MSSRCGGGFTVAITHDGRVWSWGRWANGRLGVGNIELAMQALNTNKLPRIRRRRGMFSSLASIMGPGNPSRPQKRVSRFVLRPQLVLIPSDSRVTQVNIVKKVIGGGLVHKNRYIVPLPFFFKSNFILFFLTKTL